MGISEPKIGDVVWFINDIDVLTKGKVIEEEIVDNFNGYKMYYVEDFEFGDSYRMFKSELYCDKKDLIKVQLELLMDSRDRINQQIYNLEQKLNS